MANSELTSSDVATLVSRLKRYPYLCSFGSTELGPLAGAPEVAAATENKDVSLYETQGDAVASYLIKNDVQVTIKTRNVEAAMGLVAAIKKGDNLLDPEAEEALTLVPITSESTEKAISFAHAYLQPGLNYTPGADGDPSEVSLVFLCKADATSGVPFTYAVAS